MNRSIDWLEQGELDLEHAIRSMEAGDHNWACFAAQQSAEKVIKALYFHLNMEGWGHVLKKLVEELKEEMMIENSLIDAARKLDQYYIPTRYPNGFSSGKPFDFYALSDSKEAIDHAKKIISFCKNKISSRE